MALVKTSYNLIYNDDGSLCVTLREDDVPFAGVKSFAVEKGTTNLFTNPIFQNGESGFNCVSGWSSRTIKDGGPLGKHIELVEDSMSVGCAYGNTFNVAANQTYTFSVYINVLEWNQDGAIDLYYHWFDANGNIISASKSATLGEEVPSNFVGQGWRRYKITDTAPANAARVGAFVYSSIAATSRIQVTGFQFEEKPFVTSLVVGSRPTGRLYIPLDKLGFNPAADEWVIAYWKKPFGTHINGLTGYSIAAIGYNSVDNSVGYIWWGKEKDSNTFRVTVVYNNQTIASAYSGTFDPNWYFNNWHFEVLIKTSYEIKYYVDGVLQCSLTLSYPLQTFTEGLYIGGYKNYPCNNLITNILLAKYNPIWTEEYIQTLYNTKKPFAVPPKMPII
jgi:hypothetical protein